MEIKIYLHRTKKHKFEVCECIPLIVDFKLIPEDKKADIDWINEGFKNDVTRLVLDTKSVKKNGTRFLSFIRPIYEGPEEENGNEFVRFDNSEMLFVKKY